ncbi:MAG TPA: VCBS repeat-containing protein, partial [Verrucomicrobiae bacterium]|nr:VCBS repeat-containing protein [Verrucomicrobiae bacterium]
MNPKTTGVEFTNVLQGDAYLTNAVAHNGAGVAIGDVDGDGAVDIYLCSLQGPNRLYRNLGHWRFEEMDLADAACAGQLSTGATLADVDGDGDLDLLVNGIVAGTRLFFNDGRGRWTEERNSGLSRTASATSMALADIDGDGDLDLYCAHYIDVMYLADPTTRFAVAKRGDQWEVTKVNGESTRSPRWKGRFEALPDGKVREFPEVHGLYRNDGRGHFTAIEFEPGTYLNEAGVPIQPHRDWGLAAMFRDLNEDGIPDLYVCNDNTSPDRIWINSGKGTFRPIDPLKLRHTSRSSMGVDFADLDRDGHDDIVVVDMLAREHGKRMTQLVRDRPNPPDCERIEERPQYNRNTLFFGRPDGFYVEAGFMAGVAATDWTWSPIFTDVDLDGYEDFLVTNGFEFDVMDQDSHNEIKDGRRRFSEAQLKRSMQFHPKWPTQNAAFRNRGDGMFEPMSQQWGFDRGGVSFGMAQGDLDNDGDLDLVVNNLNETVSLYRNDATAGRIAVRLMGLPGNTQGVGARIQLVGGSMTQAQEMICGGRYLSGDQAARVFAVDPDP